MFWSLPKPSCQASDFQSIPNPWIKLIQFDKRKAKAQAMVAAGLG